MPNAPRKRDRLIQRCFGVRAGMGVLVAVLLVFVQARSRIAEVAVEEPSEAGGERVTGFAPISRQLSDLDLPSGPDSVRGKGLRDKVDAEEGR